jgi:hypothetical protein
MLQDFLFEVHNKHNGQGGDSAIINMHKDNHQQVLIFAEKTAWLTLHLENPSLNNMSTSFWYHWHPDCIRP